MSFNNVISRADAAGLIPVPVAAEIIQAVVRESAALQLFRSMPLSSGTEKIPAVSLLPTAAFVTPADTGLKSTTEVNWADVTVTVEEIAAIVVIPEAVVADAAFDMWAQVRPLMANAIGRALDNAIFFGVGAPASWTGANIVAKAVAAGNTTAIGSATSPAGIVNDLNAVFGQVEADGFDVSGVATKSSMRGLLRAAQMSSTSTSLQVETTSIFGVPAVYAMGGLWPGGATAVQLIAGDFQQGILGVRQDITYKTFTEGVVTDGSGVVIQNLMQQDLVALRVVARYGFAVPNPITHDNTNSSTRYPFAVLRNAT